MKKRIVAFALLLQFLVPTQGTAAPDPKIRLAVTPMLGLVGGLPGVGFDVGMGYGMGAWGIHYAQGTEFCIMCDRDPEREIQTSFLAGLREEFAYGSVSLKSGITTLERDSKDNSVESQYGPGVRKYQGYGVPFRLDLMLSGRFIGLSLSATVLTDADGGSGSILAGIPIGLLRW